MLLKQTAVWKFFASVKLAIWLFSIIAVLSLIGTLIPQNQEPALYLERYGRAGTQALLATGLTDVYGAWWFLLCIGLFSANLAVCLCNRFSLRVRALGTTISHLSVLVILAGSLIGMLFGQKGFLKISEGQALNSFAAQNGQRITLGFSVRLDDFVYTEHIDPREKLLIYPAGAPEGQAALAEISAEPGTTSAVADTGYRVKILRYLPDFVMDMATRQAQTRSSAPNNPAIEVELKDSEGNAWTFWVFARFAQMHTARYKPFDFAYRWVGRRPKDFLSKVTILKEAREVARGDVRVNAPFRFGGYTFFQYSYDNQDLAWSALQVVKDPGVPVVYAGFVLLILGLMIIFYVNPLFEKKSHNG